MEDDYDTQLRKEILEDMLGQEYDAYENFYKIQRPANTKRQHRQRIQLWRFLLHLLQRDERRYYIEWSQGFEELEFRIKNPNGIASLWGSIKDKSSMTYEKLGRAMRYYYGKNIIEKVSNRRYSYRFIDSQKTQRYISENLLTSSSSLSRKRSWSDSSEHSNNDCPPKLTRLVSCGSIDDSSYDTGSDDLATSVYNDASSSWSSNDSPFYCAYPEEKYIFEDENSMNGDFYDDDDYEDCDEYEDCVAECLANDNFEIFPKDVVNNRNSASKTNTTTSCCSDLYGVFIEEDPFFGNPGKDDLMSAKRRISELFTSGEYNFDEIDGKCYFTFK